MQIESEMIIHHVSMDLSMLTDWPGIAQIACLIGHYTCTVNPLYNGTHYNYKILYNVVFDMHGIEDLTRVAISYEIYETSLRRVS